MKVLRVGIDASTFATSASGVARRTLELFPRALARAGGSVAAVILVAPEMRAIFAALAPHAALVETRTGMAPTWRRGVGHVRRLARLVRSERLDVLHQDVLPLAVPERSIPCVHDLRFLDPRLAGIARRSYARVVLPSRLQRARRVIVPSQGMATALRGAFDVPSDLIRVVPNGVDASAFAAPGSESTGLDGSWSATPYLLFVGHREPRKNVPFLIEVLSRLAARGRPERLVVVGRSVPGYREPERAVAAHGLGDRVAFIGDASEGRVRALYRGAAVFLFPSLLEGFGLPILEAMASGVPVVAAADPVLAEVGGTRAEFPLDGPDAWADEIVRLQDEPRVRAAACAEGARCVTRFGWDAAAARLVALWEEL